MHPMQLAPSVQTLPVRFVGSGSEYFRIWIVNLLLTLVTLGLYLPFARVRRLRYFYGSTEVAGRPLSFHGNPWKMFRGFVLVGALLVTYGVASRSSSLAAGVAALAVWALWPALWRSSMRFRLANTGWSGLRGGFSGSTGGAYQAFWPFVLPGVVLVGVGMTEEIVGPEAVTASVFGGLGLLALLAPLGLWSLRRYQHQHYAFGDEQSRFNVTAWAVYRVVLRALPVLLLAGLALSVVAGAIGGLVWALSSSDGLGARRRDTFMSLLPVLVMAVGFVGFQATLRPYFTARFQNLFWNGTRSQRLRVVSRLRARTLVSLSLKNWLLVLLTLGLYLPFAAVAMARLQLESISLLSKVSPDELAAGARTGAEAAAGDAAGDLMGVDLGL